VHTAVHLLVALMLMVLLELGVETCIRSPHTTIHITTRTTHCLLSVRLLSMRNAVCITGSSNCSLFFSVGVQSASTCIASHGLRPIARTCKTGCTLFHLYSMQLVVCSNIGALRYEAPQHTVCKTGIWSVSTEVFAMWYRPLGTDRDRDLALSCMCRTTRRAPLLFMAYL